MSAVVGVLNESLTESIKGFYKLRRAFMTLDGILAAESEYMRKRGRLGTNLSAQSSSATSLQSTSKGREAGIHNHLSNSSPPSIRNVDATGKPTQPIINGTANHLHEGNDDDEDEDEFFEAAEDLEGEKIYDSYTGNLEINGVHVHLAKISLGDESRPNSTDLPAPVPMPLRHDLLDHDPDSDIFSNPIDVFIHSGANLCFGLLLVMISMIPPAFGKLLFIIGFHGDKDRGVRMLWQASKFHNINGALAGLIVLGYYNTLVGFSDIIPDRETDPNNKESIEGYPKQRCDALLADMRNRHPKSQLWLLEEARMEAANRHLSRALEILHNSTKSPFKQVEALETFETSLDAMYSHKYQLCSESFITCVSLNNWSHALYYYIAGAAQVELYRQRKVSDPSAAKVFAEKATELLKQAPHHAGKKKFMARQLPFDVFVTRKLRKWEARAHERNVPFIDAVGVSPLEEMIFFWNGYKRMDVSQLQISLERLAWNEDVSVNPTWTSEPRDEKAILAVLRAATLRNLHRLHEAKQTLRHGVLDFDHRAELKGGLKDDWTAPAAHYEMGVICWMRRAEAAKEGKGLKVEEKWVAECETWVDKAAKWESYELETRIGLKVATAQDTIKKWRERRGLAGK